MKNINFLASANTCKGFENQKSNIVWANEIDKYACQTYHFNMQKTMLVEGDIYDVDERKIPDIDIITAGFPCQSFSVAGNQLGFKDSRGHLFFEVIRFIHAKKLRAILLENVKHLENHDQGNTFKIIMNLLM